MNREEALILKNTDYKISDFGNPMKIIIEISTNELWQKIPINVLQNITFKDFFSLEENYSSILNKKDDELVDYYVFDIDCIDLVKVFYQISCFECGKKTKTSGNSINQGLNRSKMASEISEQGYIVDDEFICNDCYDDKVQNTKEQLITNLIDNLKIKVELKKSFFEEKPETKKYKYVTSFDTLNQDIVNIIIS